MFQAHFPSDAPLVHHDGQPAFADDPLMPDLYAQWMALHWTDPSQFDQGQPSFIADTQDMATNYSVGIPGDSFGRASYPSLSWTSPNIDETIEPPRKRSCQDDSASRKAASPAYCSPGVTSQSKEDRSRRGSGDVSKQDASKLERNRQAANRCRVRKRAETEMLKSSNVRAEKQNKRLRDEVDELTDELYYLKRQMLLHADCGCTQIQACIKNGFRCNGRKPPPRQSSTGGVYGRLMNNVAISSQQSGGTDVS